MQNLGSFTQEVTGVSVRLKTGLEDFASSILAGCCQGKEFAHPYDFAVSYSHCEHTDSSLELKEGVQVRTVVTSIKSLEE